MRIAYASKNILYLRSVYSVMSNIAATTVYSGTGESLTPIDSAAGPIYSYMRGVSEQRIANMNTKRVYKNKRITGWNKTPDRHSYSGTRP